MRGGRAEKPSRDHGRGSNSRQLSGARNGRQTVVPSPKYSNHFKVNKMSTKKPVGGKGQVL